MNNNIKVEVLFDRWCAAKRAVELDEIALELLSFSIPDIIRFSLLVYKNNGEKEAFALPKLIEVIQPKEETNDQETNCPA